MIYLRGVQIGQLQSLLQFVYGGRTQVAEEDLESLLTLGRDLKIKGLDEKQQEQNVMQDDRVKPLYEELKGEDNEDHIEKIEEKLVVPDQQPIIETNTERDAYTEIKENEVETIAKEDQEATAPNVHGTKDCAEIIGKLKKSKERIAQNISCRKRKSSQNMTPLKAYRKYERLFCPVCQMNTWNSSLSAHMLVKQDIQCKACKLFFASCNSLSKHMQVLCKKKKADQINQNT